MGFRVSGFRVPLKASVGVPLRDLWGLGFRVPLKGTIGVPIGFRVSRFRL